MKLKRAYRSTSQRLPCAFVNVIGCHSSIGHDYATSSVARRSLFLKLATNIRQILELRVDGDTKKDVSSCASKSEEGFGGCV
jgi:hypothetical protein